MWRIRCLGFSPYRSMQLTLHNPSRWIFLRILRFAASIWYTHCFRIVFSMERWRWRRGQWKSLLEWHWVTNNWIGGWWSWRHSSPTSRRWAFPGRAGIGRKRRRRTDFWAVERPGAETGLAGHSGATHRTHRGPDASTSGGLEYAFARKESCLSQLLKAEQQVIVGKLPDWAPRANGRYGRAWDLRFDKWDGNIYFSIVQNQLLRSLLCSVLPRFSQKKHRTRCEHHHLQCFLWNSRHCLRLES